MKYPLDPVTFNETVSHIISHSNMQTVLIDKLVSLVSEAMDASEYDEDQWYKESTVLLEDLRKLKVDHESRRWNEANYQSQMDAGVIKYPPKPIIASGLDNVSDMGPGTIKHVQFDMNMDVEANRKESKFGEEMSEEDLDRHFNQKREKKKKEKSKKLNEMSLDEIQSWEKAQDNSNDLYKIKARVANLARGSNANLTKQGEMLVNTYVHVLKSFYDFADTLEDKSIKIKLSQLIRNNEGMPGNLIAAAGAGVQTAKSESAKKD